MAIFLGGDSAGVGSRRASQREGVAPEFARHNSVTVGRHRAAGEVSGVGRVSARGGVATGACGAVAERVPAVESAVVDGRRAIRRRTRWERIARAENESFGFRFTFGWTLSRSQRVLRRIMRRVPFASAGWRSGSGAPRVSSARAGEVMMLSVVAAATFLVVLVAGLLAVQEAAVPPDTGLIQVRPGDTLWALAQRYSPASDPHAVVQRIVEINGLDRMTLSVGQRLEVPTVGRESHAGG